MRASLQQRGSALPETVLVMSALCAVLFGIVDCGRLLFAYTFVTDAAREGARWAMVRGSQSCAYSSNTLPQCNATVAQVQAYVKGLSYGTVTGSNLTVATAYPSCVAAGNGASNAPGCVVSVTVSYPFKFTLPFLPNSSIAISSTSKMVISQ